MTNSFKDLLVDILTHATTDAMRPTKGPKGLCRAMENELATVKRDLLKAQAKLKNREAKFRELKGQIAKLNTMVFVSRKDQTTTPAILNRHLNRTKAHQQRLKTVQRQIS
ncbi:hypothetical protein GG681_17495 [Epibacterium sp. SM1969]|uniref:Uncharacterized protein n=1 Tax=Tritonibacter aquimaris TaxID=2663379 RepID=A0A844B2Z2_9RHOB|nr:hypothetical protein [Tritonibacter aquimaris]MQY44441.1 hypothetical protein [Tritonibacter aquimaris]